VGSNRLAGTWVFANTNNNSRMDRVYWPYPVKSGKSQLVDGPIYPTNTLTIVGSGAICSFNIHDAWAYCDVTRCRAALRL
jgi:hypothetical protein